MVDLRDETDFATAVNSVRAGIISYADQGISDAEAITDREEGVNNLQGHAHSLVPLAVFFARQYPDTLQQIQNVTDLDASMGPTDQETRLPIWDQVKNEMATLITNHGGDVVSEKLSTGDPQTVNELADTYLPESWGGGQETGGGGGTVVKRTLKLFAHTYVGS
jgi:hypothetical protein